MKANAKSDAQPNANQNPADMAKSNLWITTPVATLVRVTANKNGWGRDRWMV